MDRIRRAEVRDASRLAEILIFAKRTHYRAIFHNDVVSFQQMQVAPLAAEYRERPGTLEHIWVWDDGIVRGMVHTADGEVRELYVEPFFEGMGVGGGLLRFAVEHLGANRLWVLEKNDRAISFYRRRGFVLTGRRLPEEGTEQYIVEMVR